MARVPRASAPQGEAASSSSRRISQPASADCEAAILPQRGVDLLERSLARAQLLLGERVERRCDRVEMPVQVLGIGLDIDEAGDDLASGGVALEEGHRAKAIVRIVI